MRHLDREPLASGSDAAHRPRVAYLIASHRLPDQVLRLVRLLRWGSPHASLVVHHDARRASVDRAGLLALGARLVEPPSTVHWAEPSLLAMVLRCLRWCLDETDFDWLVLLSGQDYPIRPVAEIERSLAQARVDALIETRPCERPRLWGAPAGEFPGRYYFRWRRTESRTLASLARVVAWNGSFIRTRTLPSGTWVGRRALRDPFGRSLVCHRGSDWFSLSRTAVQSVDEFVRRRPDVLGYYGRTLHPTESFVQTVLANDARLRLSGEHRRHTVWGEPNQTSPRTLRVSDLDVMLASDCDFARKFDQDVDRDVLDELDRLVHRPVPAASDRSVELSGRPRTAGPTALGFPD